MAMIYWYIDSKLMREKIMTQYREQFNDRDYVFTVDQKIAENLIAWIINNTEQYRELTIENVNQIKELFPNTITKIDSQKDEDWLADKEYMSSLSWVNASNTIRSNWESWARDAEKANNIRTANIPEKIREYFLNKYLKNERIDMDSAKNFKTYPRMVDNVTVDVYHVALHQEAYGDRNIYVYLDNAGNVKTTETYYSIGD